MLNTRVELIWLLTALLSLVLGALVYILDRNPASVYFLSDNISLYHKTPGIFGQAGNHLPAFFHTFSLILITAAIIGSQKVSVFTVSLIWMLVESMFEIAQHHTLGLLIATKTPDWFELIPVLENTGNYFIHGNFDVIDLLSILAGSTVAYFLIQRTKRGGTNESLKTNAI